MKAKNSMISKFVSLFTSISLLFTLVAAAGPVGIKAKATEPQVILIKLDDIREGVTVRAAFQKVFDYLTPKNIKAGFGVITSSLVDDGKKQEYYNQIQSFAANENIEIWHHGYYHDSTKVEFSGGSLDEQYKQLKDGVDLLYDKCGVTVHTFGPPYNKTDATTIQALNRLPQFKSIFFPAVTTGGNQMMLTNSAALETATGVIDYDAFIKSYTANADKPYLVLQGHPGGWSDDSYTNFTKIVEFLSSKGVTFMTPYEYYNKLNSISTVFPTYYKFNKSLSNNTDLTVELTLNGNTLQSVINKDKELVQGTDYALSGNSVTLKKEYLMAQEKGITDLTFKFSAKDDDHLTIKVIDPSTEPVKVILDSNPLTFDVEPVIINDRVMVPFRAILTELGAQVGWDEATKTASATLDDLTVELVIDSTTAKVGGKPVTLDVPATVINDRTLVPLRFVSENLGAKVFWEEETRTVTIQSGPRKFPVETAPAPGTVKVKTVKSTLYDPTKTALFTVDGANVPDNRWSSEGANEWIQYELDGPQTIGSVGIAWYKGDARAESFEILVSDNGIDYTQVFKGESSGKTADIEVYSFNSVTANYVRILCHGNNSASSKMWNSIVEVAIYPAK